MRNDRTMGQILEAANLIQFGDRTLARARLSEIWQQIGPDIKPLHEFTLARYAARTQDDIRDEIMWNRRAVAAALKVIDLDGKGCEEPRVIGRFLPSLYLRLADACARLGEYGEARRYLREGVVCADATEEDTNPRNIHALCGVKTD